MGNDHNGSKLKGGEHSLESNILQIHMRESEREVVQGEERDCNSECHRHRRRRRREGGLVGRPHIININVCPSIDTLEPFSAGSQRLTHSFAPHAHAIDLNSLLRVIVCIQMTTRNSLQLYAVVVDRKYFFGSFIFSFFLSFWALIFCSVRSLNF